MKQLCLMICVFGLILSGFDTAVAAIYDDFEDGVIDTDLWVTHGRKGGYGGLGAGNWQYSFNEFDDNDGYLEARVWGPRSGWTYFGEASVRTAYNFNDGNRWLINFTWETTTGFNPAFDCFGIQITDGGFPQNDNCYWVWNENPPGTVTLWYTVHWGSTDYPPGWQEPIARFTKKTLSIRIDPGQNVASFYKLPNGEGSPQSQVPLDPSREWYIRFVQVDATAAGLDPGDNTFKLYHFAARPLEEGTPPIADAGDDVVADANEVVTLDGSASYDPDGKIIRYTWKRLPDEVVIYSGEDPNCQVRALGRVEEVIELTVTDNYLATATDTVRIVNRTTQDLKDQVAAMQSQIEELQQQIQELQALVDKIVSWPPIRQWLRRATDVED